MDRAREHMKVVTDLWASVEADAIKMDREGGVFADPSKVHLLEHRGKHFNVRGPLPVIPSRQGRPIIIQAGNPPTGWTSLRATPTCNSSPAGRRRASPPTAPRSIASWCSMAATRVISACCG